MKHRTYLRKDKFWTFDIETTTIITGLDADKNPIRNGIIWSGQFYDGTDYIQVRSLKEVVRQLKIIEDENKDESEHKICVFVHNLSYEFQFIKDFFNFTKILCTSERKIISAETDQIVFRCSYFLSNMALDKFLKNENVPAEFLKSKMDYNVQRFPWTKIKPDEYRYCKNDVVGLHMALKRRISDCLNEDINNLPLTSTGYVRKASRKAMAKNKNNHWRFIREKLDKETFEMAHQAFRGGNTHANKMFVNKVMRNAGSDDECSEYPAAAILFDMPTKFFDMKGFKKAEFEYYLKHYEKYAMLIEVTWKDIELINPDATPVPYLSVSKATKIRITAYDKKKMTKEEKAKLKKEKGKRVDNGRVIKAKYYSTVITELDYIIIKRQYKAKDEAITKVKISKKKPIPKELKETILHYFKLKTELKQDPNTADFDPEKEYYYNKAKAHLNSIYGMTVTSPIRPDYYYDDSDHMVHEQKMRDTQILLDEFYASFSNFLSYQIGVWITAYARFMLQEGIDLLLNKKSVAAGKPISDLLYCDTDSIKYLYPETHKDDIAALNERRKALADKRGAYIDYKGKRYYMGIFEHEGVSKCFKTFGAKKYIYSTPDGFKITISGVPKKEGKKCIIKDIKRGLLKNPFDIGKHYVFHGIKTTSCYMDHNKVHEYEIEGHKVYYASNIALYPNSYTLGLTYDFEILLQQYSFIMNEDDYILED